MKVIIIILLLFFNQTLLLSQVAASDTIWNITNKVSIKAPKGIEIQKRHACGPDCSGADSADAVLIHYNLKWEDSLTEIRIHCHYRNTTLDLMEYAKKIDQDSTLSLAERSNKVSKKMEDTYVNFFGTIWDTVTFLPVNNKYYYIDTKGHEFNRLKYTRWFLGIKYHTYKIRYKSYWERYLLVDSIVYHFGVWSNEEVKEKHREKKLEEIKPIFDNLIQNIAIKEEKEEIIHKKQK